MPPPDSKDGVRTFAAESTSDCFGEISRWHCRGTGHSIRPSRELPGPVSAEPASCKLRESGHTGYEAVRSAEETE